MSEVIESRYFNRELSWLEFNQRVLEEARDESNPLLERVKFLAITGSNLDEFFMVRVGGLQMIKSSASSNLDASGLTAAEQLDAILARTRAMVADQYACLAELEAALAEHGIRRATTESLTENQLGVLDRLYQQELLSVLSPISLTVGFEEEPHFQGGELHLAIRLDADGPTLDRFVEPDGSGEAVGDAASPACPVAVIALSRVLPRILSLPSEKGYEFLLLEDAVALLARRFFGGRKVLETAAFRITRNADMRVREDSASDLLTGMEAILKERQWSDCVRLEVDARASDALTGSLVEAFGAPEECVVAIPGPIDLSALMGLTSLHGFENLKADPWPPQPVPELGPGDSVLDHLANDGLLLVHPYQSFEPVLRMIDEAADDPDVLAIKQTLYRTSKRSPIIAALARAAQNGKNVTALVELKARFDEQRNIEWARNLETAGVHVIHGVKGLKTHAKVCIIVRREPEGIRRYVHFGTGNYNEATARLYSDVSYMTSDDDLGADAVAFFNAISGYSIPQPFRKIESAPLTLREKLLELIDGECRRKKAGLRAGIMIKVNSLVDPRLIDALYAASSAGVPVKANVRGICCLRPGVPGLSETIQVVSVVDRLLEHARILSFHHGGDDLVYISSADWMQRNLDKRIELLVPVEERRARDRLIGILDAYFRDDVKARELMPDGSYRLRSPEDPAAPWRSQWELYRQAVEQAESHEKQKLTMFEPHQGPDET